MSEQTTNFQCPSCFAPLKYDGAIDRLGCDHCGSTFSVAEIEKLYAADPAAVNKAPSQEWNKNTITTDWGEDGAVMHAYNCTSCGAEIICDATTAATSCHYCGNKTVIEGQFAGALKPDYVIPFKLSKDEAKEALKKHCKGKVLLPKEFLSETHIDEIKGVYVPFWLYDSTVNCDTSYAATKTRTRTSGDYRITDTDHFVVRRIGSVAFSDIPIDGSTKMPDDYMESIEPYDYTSMRPFSTAYMPGFFADKFDVDSTMSAPRATDRANAAAKSVISGTVTGYSSVKVTNENNNLVPGEVRYALAPVWLLTTRFKEKVYLFAMNGQTGKFVGDLPCDTKKQALLTAGWTAGLTGVVWLALNVIIPFILA